VRHSLIVILVILGVSFFVATGLAHWRENLFTRGFYFASGIWLGVLTNLVLAFAAGWLIVWLGRLAHKPPNTIILGSILLFATILFSGYGVWNALHPQLVHITVRIKNLPDAWKGKTAVQISDAHVGHIFGRSFIENVVNTINTQRPDIVFITGDLFDGMDGNAEDRVSPLKNLQAPKGTYFITGNHETYLGVQQALTQLRNTGVHVLNDELVTIDGLQILGISYPERMEKKDVGKVIQQSGRDLTKPIILLYHSPTNTAEAKAQGVDLQLAGHTHNGQIFPFNLVVKAIYRDYAYGLHKEGNYTIYTSSGTGAWGPTMRLGSRSEIVVMGFE
jgi:hypothetical protein